MVWLPKDYQTGQWEEHYTGMLSLVNLKLL
jgi:hypothetical protein